MLPRLTTYRCWKCNRRLQINLTDIRANKPVVVKALEKKTNPACDKCDKAIEPNE